MKKGTIEQEFHELLDDVADGVKDKLDITEAVRRRSSSDTAARMISNSSKVDNKIIDPEVEEYRKDLKKQFTKLLEVVERDQDFDSKLDSLLEHDIFYQNLQSDNQEVEEKIVLRLRSLHEALEKINESDEQDVWQAVSKEFTRPEAEEFLQDMFGFIDELEEHRESLEYSKEIDLSKISRIIPFDIEVDYTPEALEVMKESEQEVKEEMHDKLDKLYEDDQLVKL